MSLAAKATSIRDALGLPRTFSGVLPIVREASELLGYTPKPGDKLPAQVDAIINIVGTPETMEVSTASLVPLSVSKWNAQKQTEKQQSKQGGERATHQERQERLSRERQEAAHRRQEKLRRAQARVARCAKFRKLPPSNLQHCRLPDEDVGLAALGSPPLGRPGPLSSFSFRCGSRWKDDPLSLGGVPSQYIHIPKVGGTSIDYFLRTVLNTPTRRTGMHKVLEFPGHPVRAQRGLAYSGHVEKGRPVGIDGMSPMYMIVLREPISQIVSAFDFRVRWDPETWMGSNYFRSEVSELHRVVEDAKDQCVQPQKMLEHVYCHNRTVAPSVIALVNRTFHFAKPQRSAEVQYDYLIPASANKTQLMSVHNGLLSCALHHLLDVDIVAVTEHLESGFVHQLQYHLRNHSRAMSITMSQSNSRGNHIKQTVGEAAFRSLSRARSIDVHLYNVAKLIAAAREQRAMDCARPVPRSRWSEHCDAHAMCTIEVDTWLAEIMTRSPPMGCPIPHRS